MDTIHNQNHGNEPDQNLNPPPEPFFVRLTRDQPGRPRLTCMEGKRIIKEVALNPTGFTSLVDLDLIRRPQSIKVGAMHNWVEIDGEVFRFDDKSNGAERFEQTLNQRYVSDLGKLPVQNVLVFENPGSPTGFDVQFPACPNGLAENRRRHINEETIQILQQSDRCTILRTGVKVVLAPPTLVFKRRLPEFQEAHLPVGTMAVWTDKDGNTRQIDLSEPVDLTRITAEGLAAVFNHPAINRRAALAALVAPAENQSGDVDEDRAAA